jgi:hypothetical protein
MPIGAAAAARAGRARREDGKFVASEHVGEADSGDRSEKARCPEASCGEACRDLGCAMPK